MKFYQKEQKDLYLRSRHKELMTITKRDVKELGGSVYSVLMFQRKSEGFNHPDAPVTWKAHIPGSRRDATMGMLLLKPPALLSFG